MTQSLCAVTFRAHPVHYLHSKTKRLLLVSLRNIILLNTSPVQYSVTFVFIPHYSKHSNCNLVENNILETDPESGSTRRTILDL